MTRDRETATVHALPKIEDCIDLMSTSLSEDGRLVDLGCSTGGLSVYIADRLRLAEVYGVDRNPSRLAVAAELGVHTIEADLEEALPLPLDDDCASIVTSFGLLEHVTWYDDVLLEARRLLTDAGWLLISMPNLGSYVNRVALLFGYQPRDVEVARRAAPGILPTYRTAYKVAHLGHVHSATLRCIRELLEQTGFEVVRCYGFSPHTYSFKRVLDGVFSPFPSLSRRFLILARSRATT